MTLFSCSIGRAYGGAKGAEVKRRVAEVFEDGAQFCVLQWARVEALQRTGGFGGSSGEIGGALAARELQLAPLLIDCRCTMLSDAREQSDLSPITTFPVELRAWLGRNGSPQVGR